jgi:hypothetical protein
MQAPCIIYIIFFLSFFHFFVPLPLDILFNAKILYLLLLKYVGVFHFKLNDLLTDEESQ